MRAALWNSLAGEVPQPLPWWISILEAAAEWGKPPWEIAGDEDELLWLLRWQVYRRKVAEAEREKAKLNNG